MYKRLFVIMIAFSLLLLAGCVQILSDEMKIEMSEENTWNGSVLVVRTFILNGLSR